MGSCLGVGIHLRLLSSYPGQCSVIIIKLLSAGQEGQEEAFQTTFATNIHDVFLNTLKNRKFIHLLLQCADQARFSAPVMIKGPEHLCNGPGEAVWSTVSRMLCRLLLISICSSLLLCGYHWPHDLFFITCTAFDWDEVSVILNRKHYSTAQVCQELLLLLQFTSSEGWVNAMLLAVTTKVQFHLLFLRNNHNVAPTSRFFVAEVSGVKWETSVLHFIANQRVEKGKAAVSNCQ